MAKETYIKYITLSNFSGVSSHTEFDRRGVEIKGDNRTGKSTIMKAWFWLWTSFKDAYTNRNSNLYDDRTPVNENTPTASVKVCVVIDGDEYVIERTAKAKFKRNREDGQIVKADSDEYKTLIDGVELSATQFEAWLQAHLVSSKELAYCLCGDFFLTKAIEKKDEMRKMLLELVGNFQDSDLKGDYTDLLPLLAKNDIATVKKQHNDLRLSTEREIDAIPAKIKEKEAELARIDENDFKAIQQKADDTLAEIERIDKAMLGDAEAMQPAIQKRNQQLANRQHAQDILDAARKQYNAGIAAQEQEVQKRIDKVEASNSTVEARNKEAQRLYNEKLSRLERKRNDLKLAESRLSSLRKERDEELATVFNDDKCPTCGQILPVEDVEKRRAAFNEKKDATLKNIAQRGQNAAAEVRQLTADIAELERETEGGCTQETLTDTTALRNELANVRATAIPFEQTEQYANLKKDVDNVEVDPLPTTDNTLYTSQKKELQQQLAELNKTLGLKTQADIIRKRIIELQEEKKKLGQKLAEYLKILNLIKNYSQEKMNIVSSRVNELLNYAQLQMFSQLKNGEMVEDLIVKDKEGVRYETTNGASRLLMALDIQRFFCEKHGLNMPLWLDEASIINRKNLPDFGTSQAILMYFADCPLTVSPLAL